MTQLATDRLRLMAQTNGLAAPILGDNEPVAASSSEAGAFGSLGSAAAGVFAQLAPTPGLSVRAGVAVQQASLGNVDIRRQTMLGGMVRYVFEPSSAWMPFVEAGGWTTLNGHYRFDRTYANGAGTATGVGDAHGDNRYVYGRAGVAFNVTDTDQLALHGEVGRASLSTDAYVEPLSNANPFEAHAAAGSDHFTAVKLGVQWDHRFTPVVTVSALVQAAHSTDYRSGLAVMVPGFGTELPHAPGAANWVEYGLRMGFAVTPRVTIDVFADGVSGNHTVGSQTHVGGDLRISF